MKPTHDRLDATGIVPLAPSLDHPGVLGRSVGDLGLLWNAIAGTDPRDDYTSAPERPRLGRVRGRFDDRAEPAARAALDLALAHIQHAGIEVVEVPLPDSFDEVTRCHRLIMAAEAAAGHKRLLAEYSAAYPPRIRALVEEGLETSAVAYITARRHQERMKQAILACFDRAALLATPAAIGPAPDPSTTGDPLFNSPWSYTGLPTVSFPIGLSPDGLPLAIQLIGTPFGESALVAVAERCERAIWP
jgi:aspartyl-tRNA(Asn)/glutamyl-tRNA(Gln) amidotransferase subunit A